MLNEFASVATGKLKMPIFEVREVLSTIRSLCSVRPLDAVTHDRGLDLMERYMLSVYDAMIVAAASEAGCTVLYSEDFQPGMKFSRVVIRNPFA